MALKRDSYGPGKKRIRQLLNRASHWRALLKLAMLGGVLALAVLLRLFALEPVQVSDGSMSPVIPSSKRVWLCKLPWCLDLAPDYSPVLARTRGDEQVLRWPLGRPGDTLHFQSSGKVKTPRGDWSWPGEKTIVSGQTLYVPRRGDTLYLDSLGPMAFDFASRLYRKQWPRRHTWALPTLWNGDTPLPLSDVGRTTIGNRPVAQNEIAGLPWQELRLLEMQLQRLEAADSQVRFRRRLYADSTEVKYFVVHEDCWFLACGHGGLCVDSREEGFFRRSDLLGAPVPIKSLVPKAPLHAPPPKPRV